MKLLIIARPFAFYGGVERATSGLVQGLVDHGYDVHLLSLSRQEALPGVTLHRTTLPPLPGALRALALAAAAGRVVGRGSWDVVQSHERTLRQDIYRAGEGCHRGYLATRASGGGRGLYHRVILALERRVFARTPQIVAIARRGKHEIESLYGVAPERVAVVYNGVDLERFHPRNRATLRGLARAEAGISGDAWTVLFVGSGFDRKGLSTAIEALARLDDRESRLLVIGRGDVGPLQRLGESLGVGSRISWLGPRRDIERWYAAADVCVLPSRYEPFGNVHLEALASGLPIVTSTEAGGREVIEEGVNGAVVAPRDPGAVAAALMGWRPGEGRRATAVIDAARKAAEPFTYAAQVAGFARIYANFP